MSGGGDKREKKAAKKREKNAAKELVKSLQDIASRPLDDIRATLRECSMDAGSAVLRLLSGKKEIVDEEILDFKGKKEKTDEDELSLNVEDDEDSASSTHDLELPDTSPDELDPYDPNLKENDEGDHMIYHDNKKLKLAAPCGQKSVTPGKKKRTYTRKSLICKFCNRSFTNDYEVRVHRRAEHDPLLNVREQEHKVNDSDDKSPPPSKQPLNHGKRVVFSSDGE